MWGEKQCLLHKIIMMLYGIKREKDKLSPNKLERG